MTITTIRSRNRVTSVVTIVALLTAFGMLAVFAPADAHAADRPRNDDGRQTTTGIIAILIGLVASTGFMDYTDDACLADGAEISERSISDGTSNTIVFGARACAATR
jgi:hypothetical protein